jgi:antitoxin component YwqK of YwqJK toxin-antitoxin module
MIINENTFSNELKCFINIKVYDKSETKYKNILFENFTNKLIKSGTNFDNNKLFKIKNTMIEGIDLENNNLFSIYLNYYQNCKLILHKTYEKNVGEIDENYNNIIQNRELIKIIDYKLNHAIYKNLDTKFDYYFGKSDDLYYHGNFKEYYKNILKNECIYKDDKLDGNYKEYHNNGVILRDCNYLNGILNGSYKEFYVNENRRIECNYINGNIDGKYIEYNSDGEIKKLLIYTNGEINDYN